MLPAIKHTAIAALTALSIAAVPATPAAAWGSKEQNFLAGMATAALLGAIINDAKHHRQQPTPAYHPDPVYQPAYQPTYQPQATSIYRTATARAFQSYSTSERRLIQRRLAVQGYYRGGIDGSFGPGTYSAIAAYADDAGESDRLGSTAGAFAVLDGLIF